MALGTEMARPFPAAGGGDEEFSAARAASSAFLAAETTTDRAVDPVIWGDEKRMKRELVAWAKAVASMAAAGKSTSPSTPTTHRRRGRV
ncbi:unnamed protein product [Urochloa decumbens]|uniref:Uncharacterized protein n=1 Tax=Urochloa decumbens TaxID=240449 RepID=A0ABC9DF60_9POAL